MLTVLKSPPLVSLTGNPIRFQMQTDNFLEVVGNKRLFVIQFAPNGSGFEDDYLQLKWNGRIVRLICKPSPDGSGTQVHDNSGNLSMQDWFSKLVLSFKANYFIFNDFKIWSDGLDLYLEALEYGEEYAIEFKCSWTSELKPLGNLSGSNQVSRPFYKLGMQVIVKIDDSWIKIGEDVQPVNEFGITTFDVHSLFDDYVYPLFQYPEPSSPLMLVRPSACREYKIRYFEQFGGDLVQQAVSESDSFFVLAGAISILQEAVYNHGNTSFWAKLQYNNYFLSWQPLEKRVTVNQTEKLFFLLQEPTDTLIFRFSCRYKNGTAITSQPVTSIDNPAVKHVFELTCTLSKLQLPGWDTGEMVSYSLWMENADMERISEIHTFTLETDYQENRRLFFFENSLKGYDTICFTGDQEDSLNYDRVTFNSVLGSDFTELDHHLALHSVTETRTFKCSTGWISPDKSAWIRDFFLSKKVYLLTGEKLIPVVVTTTQTLHRKDKQELFSMDFEYRLSFSNEHYSREITASDLSNDFNGDFLNQ